MNSGTTSASPRNGIDPTKASKLLESIRRVELPRDIDDAKTPASQVAAPAVATTAAAVTAPVKSEARSETAGPIVMASIPAPTERKARARSTSGSVTEKMEIEISTGKGVKFMTFRVPKELAGKLKLVATRNQLEEQGGPATVNAIGVTALTEWLGRNAA